MKIVLASASPRRREILTQLGIAFEVITSDADETCDLTDGTALCRELSLRKAKSVQQLLKKQGRWTEDTLIIGCDTVVCKGEAILGKPRDAADAARMLRMLSGCGHAVVSGLTLIYGDRVITDAESTDVFFDTMTEADITWYISTNEPADKAGAYAIQGLAARWIKGINGCYYNVVGLPVQLLCRMAKQLKIELFS